MNSTRPVFYPNVSQIPNRSEGGPEKARQGEKSDFDRAFGRALEQASAPVNRGDASDLNQVARPLKFSAHAAQRLNSRNIDMNPERMEKLNQAVTQAETKGINDTLVLEGDNAFIVSVKNRTVITALEKDQLTGNVFTNIDGAVVV